MKKRILALALIILSVLSVWTVPTMAAEYNVTISMGTVSGEPGETVKVPLKIESNVAVSTVGIRDFSYDADALVFNGFTDFGMAATSSMTGTLGFDDKNATIALGYNPAKWMRAGICSLSFTIRDTAEAGDYDITFRASVKNGSTAVESVGCLEGTVTVVGNEPTPHVHDFDSPWSNDSANHWHACLNQPCTAVQDMMAHADNDGDGACDACDYPVAQTHVHNADGKWHSNEYSHWQNCTNQPCDERLLENEHTAGVWEVEEEATETEDGKRCKYCTVCEKLLETEVIPATGNDSEDDPDDEEYNDILDIPFVDILMTGSSGKAIRYVYENGLFNGVSESEFAPHMTMTRGMFVTVLGRMAGINEEAYYGSSFSDVQAGEWYAPGVAWASQSGIVMGYGDGTFGVNDEITVEQAVVILARYAKYLGIDTASDYALTKFSDRNTVSAWALQQMQWAIEQEIYDGYGKSLTPQNAASRELVAELIYNFSREYLDA